ncbi:NlpC/P60 family protein [Enterococcus hirae]|nr:NlpC/P60 family protein [Enterococcus hirae]
MKKSTITKIVFAFLLIGVLFNVGTSKASAATLREQLVSEAYKHIGKPYVWGGKGPNSFDCSGLTRYVYLQVTGKDIGGWTVPQESSGVVKSVSEAQPGDLLFWGSRGQSYHVAISLGSGQYIHAPQPGQTVTVGKTAWYAPSFAVDVTGNAGNESSGNVTNGWVSKNGKWHYYQNGSESKGWVKDHGAWYFMDASSGELKTGWLREGNNWYYLTASGAMAAGWQRDGNTWYYLTGSGTMATGWLRDGNAWYYLSESGKMQTGWLRNDNSWFYLNSNGTMATGWMKDNNTWYYLLSGGRMQTGWIMDHGAWYFADSNGSLHIGWLSLGGCTYYLKSPNGSMITGTYTIDNTQYNFLTSGQLN